MYSKARKGAGAEASSHASSDQASMSASMVFLPLLFYAFFCQTFAASRLVQMACIAVSFIALTMHFLLARRFARRPFGKELLWLPFLACFALHTLVYGVQNMTMLVVYVFLFCCMYVTASERGWVRICLRAIVLFALFHALCTVLFWIVPSLYPVVKSVFFAGSYMASDYRSGFTSHYSTNGIYLATGFVICFCLLTSRRKKSPLVDVLVCALLLFALVLTTKRAPLAAAVAAVVLVYLCAHRSNLVSALLRAAPLVVAIGLLVAAMAAFVPAIGDTFARFLELATDDTGNGRSDLYAIAWDMVAEHPVMGCGWGSYASYVAMTAAGAMYDNIGFTSMSTHNVYLQLLAETGVVGLCAFLVPAVGTLLYGIRKANASLIPAAAWAAVGMQIFFLVYCVSGNPLYDPQCYIPYFMSCCVIYAVCSPAKTQGRGK